MKKKKCRIGQKNEEIIVEKWEKIEEKRGKNEGKKSPKIGGNEGKNRRREKK